MSKRLFSLLISIVLLCGLFGCGAEETPEHIDPIEDIYPEMAYGVWETDVLKSEPGNYDRSARVSDGEWAETELGYYYCPNNILYYADKSNLSNWVPLCNKPQCGHSGSTGSTCSAYAPGGVCFSDSRIYFLADSKYRTDLYTGKMRGYILCSMAADGTDQKLELAWEEAMLSSYGIFSGDICQNGIVLGTQQLQEDGTTINQLFLADADGARCISSWTEEGNEIRVARFSDCYICISGEMALATNYVDFESSLYSTVVWEKNGQMYTADLTGLPYYQAYFFDGNLRFFRANDGYYDVDLTTMEEVRLCDAQLENSGMRVLQANCILESNLFYQNTFDPFDSSYTALPRVGEGALRLFNGQQWIDVELPEELKHLSADEVLHANTITSEYILFRATVDGTDRYYRLDLAAENLKLEYWFDRN